MHVLGFKCANICVCARALRYPSLQVHLELNMLQSVSLNIHTHAVDAAAAAATANMHQISRLK